MSQQTTNHVKLYIAAPLPLRNQAKELREVAQKEGYNVTSSWIDDAEATAQREALLDHARRETVARNNFRDIRRSEVLWLVWAGPTERNGSFVEAGFALGQGLLVKVVAFSQHPIPLMLSTCPVLQWDDDALRHA